MTASAGKSSITLITTDRHQSSFHPQVLLSGTPIPLNKTPKILGITFDTHFTFTPHIQNITSAAHRKINLIKTLSQNNIPHRKYILTTIYKQIIRTNLNYASPIWHPSITSRNLKKLQTTQNTALRAITGCLPTTHQQHLHEETKILPINTHLDIIGTQFYSKILDQNHPCNRITLNPTEHRLTIPPSSPAKYYSQIYNNIPPPVSNTTRSHKFTP